jgi:L-lactate dehydrogenase complex protein LldG
MNEADFLKNISRRLGREQPISVQPHREIVGAPDFWHAFEMPMEERLTTFRRVLEGLGGHVEVYESLQAMQSGLQQLLDELKPQRVGTWGLDALEEFCLHQALDAMGVVAWGEHSLAEFERVDVGLTGCSYAIANTGTLVMLSDKSRGRSVSVLPSVHIALVRAGQIRRRMGEVLGDLQRIRHQMPSSVHFISGPSRSSDIENDQSIGVHGPAAVYVLILK